MAGSPSSSIRGGFPLGLTGATAATRYVGATASGAPATGTFSVGDFSIDRTGAVYVCTVAGSPGTWVAIGGSSSAILAAAYYNPSGGVVTKTLSATVTALDTTNLRATFTAPANGIVIVKVCGGRVDANTDNPHLAVMEAAATLGTCIVAPAASAQYTPQVSFRVAGVTAGSHSYDLAGAVSNHGATFSTLKYGFTTSNLADGTCGAWIEVWAGV